MGRKRFISPDVVRLELSDGDWIEIKEELTFGESERLKAMGLSYNIATNGLDVDISTFDVQKLAMWLVDWSFRGADDKPVTVTVAAIESLEPETAQEIEAAIEKHRKAVTTRKNGLTRTIAGVGASST